MTYREIYRAALRLLGENETDGDTSDYEDRATYLLATFCTEQAPIDNRYRLANGQGARPAFAKATVELDGWFPLSDIFLPISEYYLAAMLAMDENEELSDRYFAMYADALASVVQHVTKELTALIEAEKADAETPPEKEPTEDPKNESVVESIKDHYNILH